MTAAKLKGDVDLTSHKGSILATAEKLDSEEASGAGARQFESCSGALDTAARFAPGKCATMRADIIGHFKPCTTEIYLHIDARMADYIATHP